MELVITNGIFYISVLNDGSVIKVEDKEDASIFTSLSKSIEFIYGHRNKTKHYYVLDLDTDKVLYTRRKRRKQYSPEVRKIIYNKSDGRCELCGRKISFSEMTLDHIIPLDQGGADNINNLQSTCYACNRFKSNIKPDDFMNRITEIFLYQMEKKYNGKIEWKIANFILKKLK